VSYPGVVPFNDVGFQKVLVTQCLFQVEVEVLGVALSAWFHDEAVAEGGCLETPP
jgi:hypothetical protein